MGREPNTDYHVRWGHYKQKVDRQVSEQLEKDRKQYQLNVEQIRGIAHADVISFRKELEEGVKKKMEKYEESIEIRRNK